MTKLRVPTASLLLLILNWSRRSTSWPVGSNSSHNLSNVTVLRHCANLSLALAKEPQSTRLTKVETSLTSDCGSGFYMDRHKGLELNSTLGVNVVDVVRNTFEKCHKPVDSNTILNARVNRNCHLTLCKTLQVKKYEQTKPCKELVGKSFNKGTWVQLVLSEFLKNLSGTCICDTSKEPQINPNWIGVIFSGFDKYPEQCADGLCPVNWWDYSMPEFRAQLELVSTKFSQISIYGMASLKKRTWKTGMEASKLPLIIAEMNKAAGFHKLQTVLGVFRQSDYDEEFVNVELENVISATKESNAVFPQTVWAISVQVDFKIEELTSGGFDKVVKMLKQIRTAMASPPPPQKVQVGIRLINCDKALISNTRSEDAYGLYCKTNDLTCSQPAEFNSTIQELVRASDFIICCIKPSMKQMKRTMPRIAPEVGDKFSIVKIAAEKLNSEIEIIGETGWPSRGRSENELPNTLKNMGSYWHEMSDWAQGNHFHLYMFAAFDEPWKNNLKILDKKSPNGGLCGSEAHYGWWKRVDNSVPGDYVEKVTDIPDQEMILAKDEQIENGTLQIPLECVLDSDSQSDKANKSMSSSVIILLGSCAGLGVAFVIIVACMSYRLQKAKKSQAMLSQKYLDMFLKGLPPNQLHDEGDYNIIALQFPYDKRKYEIAKDHFSIDETKVIGKGQSGTVFKGRVEGFVQDVAFKTTGTTSSIIDIKNLLSEIKILSYIGEHENIICLLGACTEKLGQGIVAIALELCGEGSLDKFLVKNRSRYQCPPETNPISTSNLNYVSPVAMNIVNNLNYVSTHVLIDSKPRCDLGVDSRKEFGVDFVFQFSMLLTWSFGIANGMEYLAGKRVIHADLASRNILLTSDLKIKITDFGLSRKLYHEMGETFDPEVPLPWRWMAPESLRHLTFSSETDVWSFAITLWEIFTLGDVPYPGLTFSGQFIQDLENGLRMQCPRHATPEIYHIILKCLKVCPQERPSFTQLKEEFQNTIAMA